MTETNRKATDKTKPKSSRKEPKSTAEKSRKDRPTGARPRHYQPTQVLRDWRSEKLACKTTGAYLAKDQIQWGEFAWSFFTGDSKTAVVSGSALAAVFVDNSSSNNKKQHPYSNNRDCKRHP